MQLHRSVFGAARTALDGAVAWGEMAVDDLVHPRRTLDGNELDAWDPDYIRRVLPLWRATLCNYFRAEVHGLDNIPSSGPSLLVGNHSGGTYIADTFILAIEFYAHFGPERRSHQLAHDIAARLPATGLSRWGTVAASHETAQKAFDSGAPVLVYPGGDWETFRPSWHSDRIEFAGRKGFIKLALERGVPIVPVVAIGGQETALFATRGERAAKATGWAKLTRIKVCRSRSGRHSVRLCSTSRAACRFRRRSPSKCASRSTLSSASDPGPSPRTSTRRSRAKCRTGCPSFKKNAHCPSSDRHAATGYVRRPCARSRLAAGK